MRSLVGLIEDDTRSRVEVRDLARVHLDTVRTKLAELRALEDSLTQLVEDCDRACAGGPGPECVILEDLATAPAKGCCG